MTTSGYVYMAYGYGLLSLMDGVVVFVMMKEYAPSMRERISTKADEIMLLSCS